MQASQIHKERRDFFFEISEFGKKSILTKTITASLDHNFLTWKARFLSNYKAPFRFLILFILNQNADPLEMFWNKIVKVYGQARGMAKLMDERISFHRFTESSN